MCALYIQQCNTFIGTNMWFINKNRCLTLFLVSLLISVLLPSSWIFGINMGHLAKTLGISVGDQVVIYREGNGKKDR